MPASTDNSATRKIGFQQFWQQGYAAGGGPLTRLISQRIGAVLAYLLNRLGLSPNTVTFLALLVSLAGSVLYVLLASGLASLLICALVYQLAYGLDCADGQLARATSCASPFGAWWDVMADLISLIVMSFAVLYWLIHVSGEITGWLFIGPAAMAIGRVLVIYSSKFTGGQSAAANAGAAIGVKKKLAWLLIDTPTLLFIICVLRDMPMMLMLYTTGMGVLYCANAGYLGLNRLSRAT